MAHFAKVHNGIVTNVIVLNEEDAATFDDGEPGVWVQTSYNTKGGQHPEGRPLRKNYAGIGYTYDEQRDAFIPPKPFESWLLNEDTCLWDPPVPYPTDVGTEENPKFYVWNEETVSWLEVTE